MNAENPKKPRVLVTRELPRSALDKLAAHFTLEVNPKDKVMPKAEILERIKDKQALLCLLTDTIDKSIIEAGSHLKVISNYAVGFNNIDVKEATKRNIPVCITPGILTETTADLTFALILSVMRQIVPADQYTREGLFKGWAPSLFLGTDVYGKTLGIIGMGRIGQAVCKRAHGFDMNVIYYSTKDLNLPNAGYVPLETLLKTSDIISLHMPLTPQTHHFISEKEFDLMKQTAFLINTTRGPTVDEKALLNALQTNKIAGAGLDVYENEPALTQGLTELKNVVLLPHIGSASLETRTKMATMAVENILAIFNGQKPKGIVNPETIN